ncbi:MAG: BACON domain-containing protein [Bacteroidetes bacterium]|nr:BACON domain-containing protein [Bacteroidota bacterium]
MKYTRILFIGFLLLAASAAAQEYRGVTLELMVDNGQGRKERLAVGIREGATSAIDPTLDESELPPQPPNEIFDARVISTPGKSQLGLGSLSDYRAYPTASNTETYTVSYQAGLNAAGVTLSWPDPLPGRITKLMIDGEDVSGKSSIEAQFITGQFVVEATFNPAPLSFEATPNPIIFAVNNRDPLPTRDLVVSPKGDTHASWVLSTEADWLDIVPASGEGEQTVVVSVNTQRLPAGTYETMIIMRSELYNVELDIPVRMEMTVGVADVPAANGMWIGQNYPNPFNPSTVIELDLGRGALRGDATLTLHNMLGVEVMDLTHALQQRDGPQSIRVDAGPLSGGVYMYTLRSGGIQRSRSMLLVK